MRKDLQSRASGDAQEDREAPRARKQQVEEVWLGDSLERIRDIEAESVHLILSDIPYGISYEEWDVLHHNTNHGLLGASPSQRKSGSIFKTRGKPLNGWSQADKQIPLEYYEWCRSWAPDWYRVLKPGASCFVFAGRRLAHRCICALEDTGFIFKDMLAWEKETAAYRAQRVSCVFERRGDEESSLRWQGWKVGNLRPLFEPVLWFMKPYPVGGTLADNILQNGVGAFHEEELKRLTGQSQGARSCSNLLRAGARNTDRGSHPAQKPVSLLEILISLVTVEDQLVLDPFCGSGSTLVAAKRLGRQYIGIEQSEDYYGIALERLEHAE